jgi:branched-subunit amino acid aminotransferase/4-amino-4-deoxychorismate lyase
MSQQDSNQQPDDPTSLSPESDKPKLVFAPGCFDNFEGTQEELQELIAEIERMFASGDVMEKARPLTDEEAAEIFDKGPNTRQ